MCRFLPFLIVFSFLLAPGKSLAQQHSSTSADSVAQQGPPPSCQSITGVVTDENYQPLTGATVQIQGINDAFSTNSEGRYIVALSKKVLPRPMRLKISAAGYETQEFALNTCQPPDVALRLVPGTRFKRDGRIKKTTSTGKIKY